MLEAVQQRLDANPNAMRQRRETVEHRNGHACWAIRTIGTRVASLGHGRHFSATGPFAGKDLGDIRAEQLTKSLRIARQRAPFVPKD